MEANRFWPGVFFSGLLAVIFFLAGGIVGHESGVRETRRVACEKGYAVYRLNEKTGIVEFCWIVKKG